ncbi:MAG: hypothetical protein NC229_08685 [Bacteroides sp.]|nr:hypothetical protein [Bacteroides sp.]MCM1403802.1 hypothetical protein [Bacteroides sp.]MCM1443546.1 hypothetical protein [Muribaculum sp.]MCM1577119.1 hypothetical protein [Bacteroides sp.]
MEENVITEKVAKLTKMFNTARLRGQCRTQQDFANFIGINNISLSKALNGEEKYLTDNLFKKIETKFAECGIITDNITVSNGSVAQVGENNQLTQQTDNTTTSRLLDEMKAQREMYDKQMTLLLEQNAKLINLVANQ